MDEDFAGPPPGEHTAGDYPFWWWGLTAAGVLLVVVAPLAYLFTQGMRSTPVDLRNTETCAANMRQVWQSAEVYSLDNSGRLPPAPRWMDSLRPYLQKQAGGTVYLKCPSFDGPYGYAMQMIFSGRPLQDIGNKPEALVFYDSTQGRPNATDALESFPTYGRHRRKSHGIFADGHLQAMTFPESRPFVVDSHGG